MKLTADMIERIKRKQKREYPLPDTDSTSPPKNKIITRRGDHFVGGRGWFSVEMFKYFALIRSNSKDLPIVTRGKEIVMRKGGEGKESAVLSSPSKFTKKFAILYRIRCGSAGKQYFYTSVKLKSDYFVISQIESVPESLRMYIF